MNELRPMFFALLLTIIAIPTQAQQLSVSTLAGSVSGGGFTDGQGFAARFSFPVGIAIDSAGTLYVADWKNHAIRKVDRERRATTIAGLGGHPGAADGTGTAARFDHPYGVAVDAAGNVYVADGYNHAIRKITPAGVVTTLAGSLGNMGTADGTGSAARFTYPVGVAVDGAGNVIVADTSNHTIRKVTPAGVVTTVAGVPRSSGSGDGFGSQARFNFPFDVAIDASGNVFVADTDNHLIRRVTADGRVTTIAGSAQEQGEADGTGSAARFEFPWSVDVDPSGNLWVADTQNQLIRKITSAGVVTTIAGHADTIGNREGIGTESYLHLPSGIVYDVQTGGVFFTDRGNHGVRHISSTLQTAFFAGSVPLAGLTNATGTAARFFYPEGITADGLGNVYVSESADTIRKISPSGQVTLFAGNPNGLPGNADGAGTAARFDTPLGMAADSFGNVYVADYNNFTIRKVTPAGVVTTFAGRAGFDGDQDGTGSQARFDLPNDVAVDSNNNVYVADSYNNKIKIIEPTGVVTTFAGSSFAGSSDGVGTSASFRFPISLDVDATRNIYVADWGNNLIRRIAPNGQVTTVAGIRGQAGYRDGDKNTALFDEPIALAARPDGTLYVLESGSHAVRRVDRNGNVTTVAGVYESPGNVDGTGSNARFYWPQGIEVDSAGRVLVSDRYNHNVRVAVLAPPVIHSFTATPSTVTKPTLVTLAWSSTGGTSATLNGQPVGFSGSMHFTPTHTTTYTLIVTGDGGTATQSVTVTFGTNRRRSVRR